MKRIFTSIFTLVLPLLLFAQGWPKNYSGVMLQGFAWDDYDDINWTSYTAQADELSQYFTLMWVPNTGNIGSMGQNMGYYPIYRYNQNTCFGSEEELKTMIQTLKGKGVGVLLDAVLNHQNGLTGWMGFVSETNPYDGKTYQLTPADVCNNDEVNTNEEAGAEYGTATGAADTGENDGGCRDLDHTSANVQAYCEAYLKYAHEYLGFTGFRYDMVKGYDGKYVGQYNTAVFGDGQIYSVGENWSDLTTIGAWISATGKKSAAFDFPLKYVLNSCCNYEGYYGDNLKGISSTKALFRSALNKSLAITFCENHDTEPVRGNDSKLYNDILAANAYILGIPGTPCVFLRHWKSYKNDIKQMILARKAAGITNTGDYTEKEATAGKDGVYAWASGNLYAVLGGCSGYATPDGYTLIIDGSASHYRYYLKNTCETAWASLPSCTFEQPASVSLTAVSADAGAKVVYTLDGTDPTASSTVYDGTPIALDKTTTLKYALLTNGTVGTVETRTYTYAPFTPHTATVYVKTDFTPVYFHLWDADGKINTNWPGIQPETTTVDGETWYYRTVDITSSGYSFNFIINQGEGKPQTSDITKITSDKYYTATISDGSVVYTDVTAQHTTGISPVVTSTPTATTGSWYTLNGMRVSKPTAKGVYIHDGKKYVVK